MLYVILILKFICLVQYIGKIMWLFVLVILACGTMASPSMGKAPPDLPNCPDDEIYRPCGPKCQPSCSSTKPTSTNCDDQCVPGCFCKDDQLRDDSGKCVPPKLCPLIRVRRNGDVFVCPSATGDHASTKLLCSTSFYTCNNWKPTKRYCKDEGVFDAKTRTCKPLEQLPECQFDCTEKGAQSMHSLGCTSFYWWCWNGRPSKMSCQAKRYFNPANDQCDFREKVAACEGVPDFIETPVKAMGVNVWKPPTVTTTTTTTAKPHVPETHPLDCSTMEDGNYPNPKQPCSDHYFMCANHITYRTPCPAMLYYNASADQCQEKRHACSSQPVAVTQRLLQDDPMAADSPDVVPVIKDQYVAPIVEKQILVADEPDKEVTVIQISGTVHYNYALNCTTKQDGNYPNPNQPCSDHFFTCANHITHQSPCPASLYYNAAADQCQEKQQACGQRTAPSGTQQQLQNYPQNGPPAPQPVQQTGASEYHQPQNQYGSGYQQVRVAPGVAAPYGQRPVQPPIFYPYKQRPIQQYQYQPYARQPSSQPYGRYAQYPPHPIPQPAPGPYAPQPSAQKPYLPYPAPVLPPNYQGQNVQYGSGPTAPYQHNRIVPYPAGDSGDLANYCMNVADGYYRHPSSCTMFIQCHEKYAYLFKCSPGLVFNIEATTCDYPNNVKDCSDPEVGTGFDRECEGVADGQFFKHPADCKKYRRCVHGRVVEQECPDQLVFNMYLYVCDYAHNVPHCKTY